MKLFIMLRLMGVVGLFLTSSCALKEWQNTKYVNGERFTCVERKWGVNGGPGIECWQRDPGGLLPEDQSMPPAEYERWKKEQKSYWDELNKQNAMLAVWKKAHPEIETQPVQQWHDQWLQYYQQHSAGVGH